MSAFFVKYTQFWGKGDEHRDDQQQGASSSEAFSRLNKRQFDAVNDLNDIMCSTIVDNAKKVSGFTLAFIIYERNLQRNVHFS